MISGGSYSGKQQSAPALLSEVGTLIDSPTVALATTDMVLFPVLLLRLTKQLFKMVQSYLPGF